MRLQIYQFSKKTTDSITSIGYAVSVSGTEVPFKSDTIETRYKFPLNYGDQYSSRGYSLMDLNPVYNGVLKQRQVFRLVFHKTATSINYIEVTLFGCAGDWASRARPDVTPAL